MGAERIAKYVDARGIACPWPTVRAAQAVKQVAPGELFEILTTDRWSVPDLEAWTALTENPLIGCTERDGTYRILIRRKA